MTFTLCNFSKQIHGRGGKKEEKSLQILFENLNKPTRSDNKKPSTNIYCCLFTYKKNLNKSFWQLDKTVYKLINDLTSYLF